MASRRYDSSHYRNRNREALLRLRAARRAARESSKRLTPRRPTVSPPSTP